MCVVLFAAAISPASHSSADLPDPWELAREADIVVAATFRGSYRKGKDNLVRLEIVDVIKGSEYCSPKDEIKAVDNKRPADTPGRFFPAFSENLREGDRLGACLNRGSFGRWELRDVDRLADERSVERWTYNVRRFFTVFATAKAEDPAKRYRELLPLDGPILLDAGARGALERTRDRHAAPILREMLRRALESPRPFPPADQAVPEILIPVLGGMHDAESLELVMKYIAGLPVGKRGYMYDYVPGLVSGADVAAIRKAMVKLKPLLDQLPDEETIRRSKDAGLSKDYRAGHQAYRRLETQLLQATK